MITAFEIFRTKGPKDQHSLTGDALREMPQQINARWIGPMQIFKEQNHGCKRRQGAQRVAHLAQHTLLGRANRFLL